MICLWVYSYDQGVSLPSLPVARMKRAGGVSSRVPAFRCGFTLVEVLISILLISILFSLGILFSSSMNTTKRMRNYEVAISFAQQAIEAFRAAPFDTLDNADCGDKSLEADFNTETPGIDLFKPTLQAGNILYERSVNVESVDTADAKKGAAPRLKYLHVTVKWAPPDGERLTYEMTTTIADIN